MLKTDYICIRVLELKIDLLNAKIIKNKLYILIDKNLDPIYGAVQGGHAVAEWLIEHG